MYKVFFIMSPFFITFGLFFFFLSFLFMSLSFSFFLHWNLFFFSFSISFPFYLDYISCIFMGMVSFISGSIIYYSEYYMSEESYKSRFFLLMFFFVVSMIFLILSPNFLSMLLGWDGLGLISYCLVIYYQNFKSFCSGMITALTNRVGDVFILACLSFFFSFGGYTYINFLNVMDCFWVSLFFFIASMTKSAQIPFSAWLPAAMAAPTPVSSLVHSSTLVTAGVYILIRFDFFLNMMIKNFLMFISLLTMIMSGISGLLEYDLKKIIALSTLSQLGFMMATISLGFSDLAFFHLITHASFKALLFMCAGIFIHSFNDNQDIRSYGMMNKTFSFSLCMFNVANLSLSGFPFLSGFFSKDLILELVLLSNMNFFFLFLFMFGTFLTVLYSFRLLIFLNFKNSFYFSSVETLVHFLNIQNSMFLLFIFSVSLGFFGSNLFFFPYNYIILPISLKLLVSFVCLISFTFAMSVSKLMKLKNDYLQMFLSQMWFLNYLKTDFFKSFFFYFSFYSSKSLIGFVELMGGMKNLGLMFSVSIDLNRVLKSFIFFFFLLFLIFCYIFLFFFG
uniref:NADH dehydrogenase subunit 5 n=1 Tax=Arorathrips mexicanus TaxID=1291224 RepID=UPI0030DEA58E